MLGGREKVTQIEQDVSAQATVAGINGDLLQRGRRAPGRDLHDGRRARASAARPRSSIGVDSAGGLHVDRVKFFGTWQGTGQRRPLNGLNQVPAQGQVVLLTPAFGPKAPAISGLGGDRARSRSPPTAPNTDLTAAVTRGRRERRRADPARRRDHPGGRLAGRQAPGRGARSARRSPPG